MHTPFVLFLGDLGGGEIMLIMVVILIFFGANKIPELARGLGKGIREFKDASTEIRKEFEGHGLPAPPPQAPLAQAPYAAPYAIPTTTPNYAPLPGEAGFVAAPVAFEDVNVASETAAEASATVAAPPEPLPPVPSALPPNLAPAGTQPRQPFVPAAPQA